MFSLSSRKKRFSTTSTSLTARLFLASAVLLPIALSFSATMLNHAYQRSLRAAERDALIGQIYILLGAAEPEGRSINLPMSLAEPRYESINSGLMAWVVDSNGIIQWRSKSSELLSYEDMPRIESAFISGKRQFFSNFVQGREYYAITYDTIWDTDNGELQFRFVVMQSRDPMRNELKAYQKRLWKWLGGLAVLLTIIQTLIAKWSLRPLNKLASDLQKVEAGHQQQLAGKYPAEIQPVTDNLNRVLRNEQAQRERYRNTLSDLAHSLKTPLAVISGHLQNPSSDSKSLHKTMDEQVSRMSAIVGHQLRRANAQVSQAADSYTHLKPMIERLTRALDKVYQQKTLTSSTEIPDELSVHCDETDLMELLGNIIENAYKYGNRQVYISARELPAQHSQEITVEDDGPGVADDVKRTILTRGARADTATPGQGIGLSVTVDILSSYGGKLDIMTSKLGGARFTIQIPDRKDDSDTRQDF